MLNLLYKLREWVSRADNERKNNQDQPAKKRFRRNYNLPNILESTLDGEYNFFFSLS